MIEESTDSGNTSFLSQSYARGIKRISGKFDETQDEFAVGEEIVEARKKSWAKLFEKFAKATDTTELNYRTLRPVEESDESEEPVRIPVRKSSAQIQHWIDTGNAPCLVLELKGSDDESISISESEAEEPEQFQSSASRSMIAALKPMDTSHERRVESRSSLSSVDTAAYIKSSATSRGEKRPRNSDPGRLDNGKVARSMNAAWPKVLVTRLPDPDENKKGNKAVENAEISQDLEKEVSRESSVPKKRKLYTGTETLVDLDADDPQVESSPKIKIHRKSIHPAMDSPSTFRQRKTMSFGPRLLTATWRQSRNNSITKRFTRKKSTLFRPRTPITTRRSLRRTVNAARNSAKKRKTVAPAQNKEAGSESSMKEQTKPQTSSSVGSKDVSQIITEDLNSQLSIVARAKRTDEDSLNLDAGSIFKVRGDFCEETSENRKHNMEHAKKNLYRTLLRFSHDSESALASESNFRELKIILHDFLDLRECCGKLERSNNEYWLRRIERNRILSEEEEKSSREKLKKKMRSERKPNSSKQSRRNVYKTRFDFATDSSNASEKPLSLEIAERNEIRAETGREKVKFSNTTCNQSSFIIQSCSEDEDIFELLTSIKPKSRSKNQSDETIKTTNTLRRVSSSSETEEEPVVEPVKQIKKKKTESGAVRRSKRKSSSKIATVSESQQIQSQYSSRSESSVEFFEGPTASKSTRAAHASTVASSSSEKEKKEAEKVVKTHKSTKEDAKRSKKRNSTKTLIGSESSDIFQRTEKKLSTRSRSSRKGEHETVSEQNSSSKIATLSESQQIQSQYSNKSESSVECLSGPTASKSTKAAHASTVASSSSEKEKKEAEKVDSTQKSTTENAGRSKKTNSTKTLTGSESPDIFQRTRKKLSTSSRSSKEEGEPEMVGEQSKNMESISEKKKGVRDLPLSEAEVNGENIKDRGSRDFKLNTKSRNTEVLISNKADETPELEIIEDNDQKENRRRVNGSGKKKISNVKKARRVNRIKDSNESGDDGSTNSPKMVDKATCNRLSTLIRYFSDESSIGDDTMIFAQKNYAGSNSIEDESKRAINFRSLRSSKKRSRKPCLTSTVVYRTKESWETDSDHL